MTDYYKCEECGTVFTEWEMNFKYASENGKCLCQECIAKLALIDTKETKDRCS